MLTKNVEMCLQKLSSLPDCDHGNALMQSPVMLQSALSSHSYLIYFVDNLKGSSVYWKNNAGVENGGNSRVTKHEVLTGFLPLSLIVRLVVFWVPSPLIWKGMKLCNAKGNGQLVQLVRAWCL